MSDETKSPDRQSRASVHLSQQPTPNTAESNTNKTPFRAPASVPRPRADLGRTSAAKRDYGMVMGTPMGPGFSPQGTQSEIAKRVREPHTHGIDELDDDELEVAPDHGHQPETMVWGTEIHAQSIKNSFQSFLNYFKPRDGGPDTEAYYIRRLQEAIMNNQPLINIDCAHLREFPASRQLAKHLQQVPGEVISILDVVIQYEASEIIARLPEDQQYFVMPANRIRTSVFGLEVVSRMRALDPEHIETLLTIKGMVVRCSTVVPDLKSAHFQCSLCRKSVDVVIDKGKIAEPPSCPACQALGALQIIHNRCTFADKQLIRLQETPDEVPEGETPHTITIFAFDELVDTVRPGDRIAVTGILRAVPRRPNSRQRSVQAVFKTYLDAIHFAFLRGSNAKNKNNKILCAPDSDAMDKESEGDPNPRHSRIFSQNDDENHNEMDQDDEENAGNDENHRKLFGFSRQMVNRFHAFAERHDVYDALVRAFAPSVFEMDDVKRGLLCLLFGGTSHADDLEDNGSNTANENDENEAKQPSKEGIHQRGDINILLCGDPGTSKSQLLGYVHSLSPRGIYTSGKGSSAVGLTASVARDPETREIVLESGALVLSDKGVCCIDEFDKMSQTTRAVLHEAMEQQTVSITKAGIVATLNARTAILASANPLQSRYNPRLSVVDNIQLPPTLLSRFDLIYLILDKQDAEADRRLAQHLVSMYFDDNDRVPEPSLIDDQNIDQAFLREYIAYARLAIPHPQLSLAAQERLVTQYLEMRGGGNAGNKTISATPRQLESLIRISQALAKMRLSDIVREHDVAEASRLMRVATQTAATDPRTGTIDMDLISTGRAALDRMMLPILQEEIRLIMQAATAQGSRQLSLANVRQQLLKMIKTGGAMSNLAGITTISMADVEEAVRELEGEGFLTFMPRSAVISMRSSGGGGGGYGESEMTD